MDNGENQIRKSYVEFYRTQRSLEFLHQYEEEECWMKIHREFRRRRLRRKIMYTTSVAAMLAVMIGSVCWLYDGRQSERAGILLTQEDSLLKEEKQGIVLSLADGRKIDLTKQDGTIQTGGVVIHNQTNQELVYQTNQIADSVLQYNQLTVPRGGEYKLILADGSKVWVNSETRLTYPVAFGERREITLEGEAYFEVTHDEKRPFVVHTGEAKVVVLGTEFNVNSYNLKKIWTVLVKGSVQVLTGAGSQMTLKPGELAQTENGEISVFPVNVRKYIAWRYGEFYFDNTSLAEIMEELAEWYDVQVVFRNTSLKQRQFSGVLKRSESITEVLEKIEQTTSVHFTIHDNIVSVQ